MQCTAFEDLPFEKLFQIGEEKYESMDYEQAEYFYELAYRKNPNNDMILLCYSHCLKNNDKAQLARQVLVSSLKQVPIGNYKRYFELAEIYDGVDSIKMFEKGIAEATKGLKNPFLYMVKQQQIARDVAQAYASIAEVCMTDLLQQKQAEGKCLEALEKGKQADDACMDVHLQIGNYYLFKERFEEAKTQLLGIHYNIMSEKQDYESQLILGTGKYLIELQEYTKSMQLFEKLHNDQSNEVEVLYLLAFCAFRMQKYEQCQDYLEEYDANKEKALEDEEMEEAVRELRAELTGKRRKDHEDTGEGDEEQWVDMEDEDNQDCS